MKPRTSKVTDAGLNTAASKLEIERLSKQVEEQKKDLDALRIKNANFAKSDEAKDMIIQDQTSRNIELNRDNLKIISNNSKLRRKLQEVYEISSDIRNNLVNSSNQFLNILEIIEESIENTDLTFGKIDTEPSLPSTSKSNIEMKVLPRVSGYTIQKPTISLRKSDSQQINDLIQHQNGIQNDLRNQLTNSMHNNFNSSSEHSARNSLENRMDRSEDISPNNTKTSNDGTLTNEDENVTEEVEDANDAAARFDRLSTVLEMSNATANETCTNNVTVISNITIPVAHSSANSTSSFNRSKKRASIMPIPINISTKISRITPIRSNSLQVSSKNSTRRTASSSSGISTRCSGLLPSITTSYDPCEGPSTLLDPDNELSRSEREFTIKEGQPLSSSTPMPLITKSKPKCSINVPQPDFVTTRKSKSKPKIQLNFSKSLNDLSSVDDRNSENEQLNSQKRSTRQTRQLYSCPNNESAENLNNSLSPKIKVKSASENAPTKTTIKRGRPKKGIKIVKAGPQKNTNRKSRSYSPNYRFEVDVAKSTEKMNMENCGSQEDQQEVTRCNNRTVNPTVRLERIHVSTASQKSRNKRRSRSFSPARSETSDKSDVTECSMRSSRRTKIVNYNEPSLRAKMRRK